MFHRARLVLSLPLLAALSCANALASGAYDLELIPLKSQIYLLRRPEPLRQPVEGNVTVIVNESDVVVVDGGGAPLAAENAIKLIRSVTPMPVTVLINTHWHGDHTLGHQAYRAAFPGVQILSHVKTRENMQGEPMRYVERYPEQIGGVIRDLREDKAKGTLKERHEKLLSDLEVLSRELGRIRVTPPDTTFTDSIALHRGKRTIHVKHVGRANTDGDAMVWLPEDRVLITGDVVVHPIPYGFGSFPRDWIATLDAIREYPFELLVPGHGEVQRDRSYVYSLRELLTNVREQVAASVKAGRDLDATRKAIDPSQFPQLFRGDDPVWRSLFQAWWVSPITRSAWLEARGEPIKQGASDETG